MQETHVFTERDYENLEERLSKVENSVEEIRVELKEKSVQDAKMEKMMETVQSTILLVQSDTKEIRNEMMKLVMTALDKSTEDGNAEKVFYRKLIIGSVTILGTIVLAAFGITKIMPFFQ